MKKSHKSALSLLLSILMVLLCVMPAQAAQTQPTLKHMSPVTTVFVGQKLQVSGVQPGDTTDYVTTIEEAAQILREGLEDRQSEVAVPVLTTRSDDQLMRDILDAALVHTGVPTQGDYLHWQLGTVYMGLSGYSYGSDRYLILTYTPTYYTSADQEEQLDHAVDALLDQLNVYNASDYNKVRAIYDYICNNVVYDHAGLAAGNSNLIYTAYAALINGTAVCQGYANLFYRLALELGVDARLIAGTGNGGPHGWNIVELDGKYYNLDATWDAEYAAQDRDYAFFLRCPANFGDHYRYAEYDDATFHSAYPMGAEDYTPVTGPIPGDIDSSGKVNSDDVIRLLLHVSMPSLFPISVDADFTGDGFVTSDDVIRLLLHVSMPSIFPL